MEAKRLMAAAYWTASAIAEQTILEFLNAAVGKQKLPFTEAARVARSWLSNFALMLPPASIIEDTFALLGAHRLSVWDARLLAVCGANGCDVLLSEDMTDGARYGSVRVLNPFNARNSTVIAKLLAP